MIGRKEEQRILHELALSGEPEFVVIYGRRRVGKTFLVRETFSDDFLFFYTGIANRNARQQRIEFTKALREYGWAPKPGGLNGRSVGGVGSGSAAGGNGGSGSAVGGRSGGSAAGEWGNGNGNGSGAYAPENWFDAFDALRELIASTINVNNKERILIFLDEMPWMDNKKSDFVPALEHFWNGWASGCKNIMLIVCGSAASWITKKIFRNKGGLYNRATRQIALKPFTLAECKEYFDSRSIAMNTQDLIESYMIFGGIPYYLRMLEKRYSLALNVDRICFGETAPLRNEFEIMMDTLYANPVKYMKILEVLHEKKKGLTRENIANLIDFGNGGNLTKILLELEECNFIRKYKPFGNKKNCALYYLSDAFTAFHLTFMRNTNDENYWSSFIDNAVHRAWSGYAFEQVCLTHVNQIKKSLGISGIHTDTSSWSSRGDGKGDGQGDGKGDGKGDVQHVDQGAQIDLVIDRSDRVINLCEIKFSKGPFEINRAYDLALRRKIETFRNETKTRKALHLTMITTYGVKPGKYAGIVQSEVNMDELL